MVFGCCRRRKPAKSSSKDVSQSPIRDTGRSRVLNSNDSTKLGRGILSSKDSAKTKSNKEGMESVKSCKYKATQQRSIAADDSVSSSTKSVDSSISSKPSFLSAKTPATLPATQQSKNDMMDDADCVKSPSHVHFQDVPDKPIRPTTSEFRSVEAKWIPSDPLKNRVDHQPISKLKHDSKCAGDHSFGSPLSSITEPLTISISPTPTNTPAASSESNEHYSISTKKLSSASTSSTLNPAVIGFIQKICNDNSLKLLNTCDVKTAPEASPIASRIEPKVQEVGSPNTNNVSQKKNEENPVEKVKATVPSDKKSDNVPTMSQGPKQ